MEELPRLYRDLAEWWPLLSAPEDYAEEAAEYRQVVLAHARRGVAEVLELGSGGGNNASYMKAWFRLTLVDLSPAMLEVSRRLNPDCEHLEGDMRSVRLGRDFDAVFVHDAVAYLTTEEDLRAAFETAFVHRRPGGVALFVPDEVRENFAPGTDHGGQDGPDRALRYLEWFWDPNPNDTTIRMDLTYVFHESDGSTHVEHDPHVCGLFPRATWLDGLATAGFEVSAEPLAHEGRQVGAEGFVGVRPI